MNEMHPVKEDAPRMEWMVRAENGSGGRTSEDIALAVAAGSGGYTLGPDRSPLVEAFCRVAGTDEWTRVTPPEATANAARPEGDDSSAREGITAR